MTVARAVWGYIESRDHRLMRRVHRWRAPKWIRIWMMLATRCGDGWIWYLLGAILLLFGGRQRFLAVGSGAVAVAVGILLFKLLKNASHRVRPCQLEPHCWAAVLPPTDFRFRRDIRSLRLQLLPALGFIIRSFRICCYLLRCVWRLRGLFLGCTS